jgi:ribosomal protein L16/L10AE
MGKGKGKNSSWSAKIPINSIFIEFKNVRLGRSKYFLNQVTYKLPGKHKIVSKYDQHSEIPFFKKANRKYNYFF